MYLFREPKLLGWIHLCQKSKAVYARRVALGCIVSRPVFVFDMEHEDWYEEGPEFGRVVRYCPLCGKDLWKIKRPRKPLP